MKAKPAAPVQASKKPPVSKKWEGEDEDEDGPAVSSMGLNKTSSHSQVDSHDYRAIGRNLPRKKKKTKSLHL